VTSSEPFLTQGYAADDRVNWTPRRGFANGDFPTHHSHIPASFMSRHPVHTGQYHALYQPVMQANEHNVRAFCPPSFSVNESLSFGQNKWHVTPSTWDLGGFGQGHSFQTKQLPSLPAHDNPGPEHMAHSSFGNGPSRGVSLNIRQNPYLDANLSPSFPGVRRGVHNEVGSVYPQFKEKAMLQAHRSYVDLLAYLQATRKLHYSKPGSTTYPSSKLLVYPKPPKPTLKEPHQFDTNACSTPGNVINHDTSNNHHHHHHHPHTQYQTSEFNRLSINPSGRHPKDGFPEVNNNGFAGIERLQTFTVNSVTGQAFPNAPSNPTLPGNTSVYDNARASLQLIQSLCEQSDWKWVEGLLLAGCLQYGLEQYDDALKSFCRITALDARYKP
jgi:hypothetical protein